MASNGRGWRERVKGSPLYDAFISYSHVADGRLIPALQSGLPRLAEHGCGRPALRVFRDEIGL